MSGSNSTTSLSNTNVLSTAEYIAFALGDEVYAIVGGAAIVLLGGSRTTEDVDIVVARGSVPAARQNLAAQTSYFTVEPRTRHTHSTTNPPIEVELLSPPGTFKEAFDSSTSTMEIPVGGRRVRILHPLLLFNAKCGSILGRATNAKKQTDAYDIEFLLAYIHDNNMFQASSAPNATQEFAAWFIASYGAKGTAERWRALGYTV